MFRFEREVTQRRKHKFVKNAWDDLTGKSAAESAQQASQSALDAQTAFQNKALGFAQDQFNWSKGIFEEDRARQLGYLNQLGDTQGLINAAKASPFYQSQLAQIGDMTEKAEAAALRNRSATGGLRGGASLGDAASLAERQTLLEGQALSDAYGQQYNQIANLAGLSPMQQQPTGAGITSLLQNMGQTQAQGIIGGQQSANAAQQAGIGNLFGLANLGIGGALAFSDERLKENIIPTGYENNIPTFKWTWNDVAKTMGLEGEGYGTLSKHAKEANPESVKLVDGFEAVNYDMIGVKHG